MTIPDPSATPNANVDASNASTESGLSRGAVIGIAVGASVVALILLVLLALLIRKKRAAALAGAGAGYPAFGGSSGDMVEKGFGAGVAGAAGAAAAVSTSGSRAMIMRSNSLGSTTDIAPFALAGAAAGAGFAADGDDDDGSIVMTAMAGDSNPALSGHSGNSSTGFDPEDPPVRESAYDPYTGHTISSEILGPDGSENNRESRAVFLKELNDD